MRTFNKPFRRYWAMAKRHIKWGALLGVGIAVICHFLPSEYHGLCDAVAACIP